MERYTKYREAGDVPTGQAVGAPPRFGWRHRGDTLTQALDTLTQDWLNPRATGARIEPLDQESSLVHKRKDSLRNIQKQLYDLLIYLTISQLTFMEDI